jgi:hypothetical protein
MKKIMLIISACVALISCEPVSTSDLTTKSAEKQGMCVKCKLKDSFQSSKNWKDVETRAVESVVGNVKKVSVALLDSDLKVVQVINQNEEKADFGKINMNCEPGNYTLVCVAHSSDVDATIADGGIVSFSNNKIKDCFCKAQAVTVYKNKRKTINVTLGRCVSKLRLESTEVVPDGVSYMNIALSGVSTRYDAINECGVGSETLQKSNIDISALKGAMLDINVYTFLPSPDSKANADIQFMNASHENLYSLSISNFEMKPNTESCYNGNIFVNGGVDSDIMINMDWNTVIDISK